MNDKREDRQQIISFQNVGKDVVVLWIDGTEELQGESVHHSEAHSSFCGTPLRVTAQVLPTNAEIRRCFYLGLPPVIVLADKSCVTPLLCGKRLPCATQ